MFVPIKNLFTKKETQQKILAWFWDICCLHLKSGSGLISRSSPLICCEYKCLCVPSSRISELKVVSINLVWLTPPFPQGLAGKWGRMSGGNSEKQRMESHGHRLPLVATIRVRQMGSHSFVLLCHLCIASTFQSLTAQLPHGS